MGEGEKQKSREQLISGGQGRLAAALCCPIRLRSKKINATQRDRKGQSLRELGNEEGKKKNRKK